MTNKLGTVVISPVTGSRHIDTGCICPVCGTPTGKIIDLPEKYKDLPAGLIVYLDDDGKITFMDGDPNDG